MSGRIWDRNVSFEGVIRNAEGLTNYITFDGAKLHIGFDLEKTDDETSNGGSISIYNINDIDRGMINANGVGYSTMNIYAGYGASRNLIFSGDITEMKDRTEGGDCLTTFQLATGFNAKYAGEVSASFPAGTSNKTIFQTIIDKLKSIGHISGTDTTNANEIKGTAYRGVSLSANRLDWLAKMLPMTGNTLINVDGILHIQRLSDKFVPTCRDIYYLNAESGMIGVPEQVTIEESENPAINEAKQVGEIVDTTSTPTITKIGYMVRTLLHNEVKLGSTVVVTSKRLKLDNVALIVSKIRYIGSNYNNDFYTEITAFKASNEFGIM